MCKDGEVTGGLHEFAAEHKAMQRTATPLHKFSIVFPWNLLIRLPS